MDEALRGEAERARADVVSGALRGDALLARLRAVPSVDRDAWVDALLGIDDAPPDVPDLPRGAVPYLPCGVNEIVAAVLEAPIRADDELVDLGAGLGRVAILGHLLSGARASGVEIQEPLVVAARARSAALRLDAVTFMRGDAADLAPSGSVFFLYAPFNGDVLRRVVRHLEDVARQRRIVLCAVDLELRDVPWLRPRATSSVALVVYESTFV